MRVPLEQNYTALALWQISMRICGMVFIKISFYSDVPVCHEPAWLKATGPRSGR